MNFNDDKYLDVCQTIEVGLKMAYEPDPGLTETKCVYALDRAKIAVKRHSSDGSRAYYVFVRDFLP